MNREDLIYIAGLFDGEGTIYIYNNKHKSGSANHMLWVKIGITNQLLLEWISSIVGYGKIYSSPKYKSWHKQMYVLAFSENQAIDFLLLIVPWLKEKKSQAELAIAYKQAKTRYNGKKIPDEEFNLRESYRNQLIQLKC